MNDVKSKSLAGRINQYVNYRRQRVKSKQASFNEALSNQSVEKTTVATEKAVQARSKSSSRTQLHARKRGVGSQRAGRTYLRKHITKVQAGRLAQYAPAIQEASRRYRVPVELICGVILQESGGNYKAVSHCGARGLMQLMPGTAKRMGVNNSFDPVQNIMGGTKYLRFLLDRFDGNVALACAGYNAGEGNVEKYGRRIPPFKETQAYVPNVLKYADTLWNILRSPARRADVRPVGVNPTVTHRTIYNVSRRA